MRKGFFYLVTTLACIFAFSITTFAQENSITDTNEESTETVWTYVNVPLESIADDEVEITASTSDIIPYANPKDLKYENGRTFVDGLPISYVVTPTAGRALRIWAKVDWGSSIKISVKSFYKTYDTAGEDYEAVASCNGGSYTVTCRGALGTVYSILIYETGG